MNERELFEAALEQPPGTRAGFLDRACAGSPEVRQRLEALLAREEQAGSFLEGAVALDGTLEGAEASRGFSPPVEAAGQVLNGRYKLLEPIGEGGMGTVWLAMQTEPVRRRVAVKLIKAGMDSRLVLSRFEAERQALALMDHPNIAKVLDGGSTEQGRPFFVMEYVKGVPITEYCEEARLSIAERLELFVPVCQAVQHAHQKGIIHRDLKPTNLLICLYDDKPVSKVIDFGLAKAMHQPLTQHTLYTAHGLMLGTPLYMSPEQAAVNNLDVDTRSDIYSLGVVLYELLTGTTPLEKAQLKKASWPEILRLIKETEPPKPSTRISQVRSAELRSARVQERGSTGAPERRTLLPRARAPALSRFRELDWIVMKALDKDRSRRYETANGLARDLTRYLHDEPVEASPPSAWYRLRKLARRNRAVLTTGALVLLALVLGTAVSVWQALRATDAMNSQRETLIDLEKANKDTGLALDQVKEEQKATGRELQRTKEAKEKATRELFDSLVAQARANRLSRRIGQRFGTFKILGKAIPIAHQLKLPAERFLDMRNEALAAMALTDLRIAKEWTDDLPGWFCFDDRLRYYARNDQKGRVHIRRAGDGAELCRLDGPGPGENNWPWLSPDGRFLSVRNSDLDKLQLWRLAEKKSEVSKTSEVLTGLKAVKVLDQPCIGWGSFSRDSRQIAFQHSDRSIAVYDLASLKRTQRLPPIAAEAHLTFDTTGRRLAVAFQGITQVHDLTTGRILWKQDHASAIQWIDWHPDGKTLAVQQQTADSEFISLWDVTTGKETAKVEAVFGGGPNCTFNRAGTLLASVGWNGKVWLWDPRSNRRVFSNPASWSLLQFNANDRYLAASQHGNKLRIWEVAASGEYQTLTANTGGNDKRHFNGAAISPDGHMLAGGTNSGINDGIALCDWPNGKPQAFIEGGNCVLWEPTGALLTMGSKGLFRQTIRRDPDTGSIKVGAPEKLPVPGVPNNIASSSDGRVLASAQFDGAVVLHADRPDKLIKLGPHSDVRHVTVSPDGRWVVTGGFTSGWVKVWDAQTGKHIKDLDVGRFCWVVFSPDGKRLLTNAGETALVRPIRAWQVGTWAESPFKVPLKGMCPNFSPDGKLLAVETGEGAARLVDAQTGKELACLEDPDQHRTVHFVFSQDNSKLVCSTQDGQCLHVWDLAKLRKQLAEMGLDW